MIAADLGYKFIDEREIKTNNLALALELIDLRHPRAPQGVVLHAPGLCHLTHLLWDTNLIKNPPAVLMMIRDLTAIRESEERVGWNPDEEIRSYLSRPEFAPYLTIGLPVARWKYDVWRRYQQPLIHRLCGDGFYYSIHYTQLSQHELWVPKDERSDGWQWDTTERTER